MRLPWGTPAAGPREHRRAQRAHAPRPRRQPPQRPAHARDCPADGLALSVRRRRVGFPAGPRRPGLPRPRLPDPRRQLLPRAVRDASVELLPGLGLLSGEPHPVRGDAHPRGGAHFHRGGAGECQAFPLMHISSFRPVRYAVCMVWRVLQGGVGASREWGGRASPPMPRTAQGCTRVTSAAAATTCRSGE